MQLQGISRIIQTFKPAECEFIRDYYLRKSNGSATKRLQLFDLLKNQLSKDNEQVCRLLYNRKPDSGFSQLKKRLKQDLLDFMVFFPSTKNDTPDNSAAELECRKLFVQAKTLVHRGIEDEAMGILKRINKLAKDFDLPQMKALSLELLQEISDQSFKDFTIDSAKVERDLEIHLTKVKSRNLYRRLIEKGVAELEKNREDQSLIIQLKVLCENCWTPSLGFWHHLIALKVNLLNDKVGKAYWHGLRLDQALKSHGGALSKDQLFDFYHEMAVLLAKARKPNRAELYARKAEMLCSNDCEDLLRIFEVRFVLAFARKEYEICLELWQAAMSHSKLENDDLSYVKWVFFEACLQFVESDFDQSLVLLRKSADLSRDKNGFFIEHRLLEILNLIELGEHDLLEYKVENFRKLIEYHQDKCPDRIHGVMKLLRTLVKTGYDLDATYAQESENLERIVRKGMDNQLMSLIDVQGWIESKVNPVKLRLVG